MISLSKVYFSYEKIPALKDINLNIRDAEAVALIGPNGSGKSTLLKLINGLIGCESGSYYLDGEEITLKKLHNEKFSKAFHKKIGFVFQNSDSQLFCSSVYDEIAFGPRQLGMDDNEVNKRVEDMLKLLSIEDLKYRIPYHLSGGEKKKVAIAAVLALNPEVIILDEPMNGLDPKTKRFIRDFLKKLNAAGKTLICSTHDFDYVEGVFSRAVVFSKDHTIIRDGDYTEILNDTDFLFDNNII